jgi:hypothetical protein
MGYTHYWSHRGFTPEQWKKATELAGKIINASSVPVQFEYDVPKPPMIDGDRIRFNGVDDDGYETFVVYRDGARGEFCKTARRPYDEIVVATLFALEAVNDDFTWSSDGDANDHKAGYNLYKRAAGLQS